MLKKILENCLPLLFITVYSFLGCLLFLMKLNNMQKNIIGLIMFVCFVAFFIVENKKNFLFRLRIFFEKYSEKEINSSNYVKAAIYKTIYPIIICLLLFSTINFISI